MLSADYRIPAKLIPLVARKGKRHHQQWFSVVFLNLQQGQSDHPYFAVVVSTNVSKSAVVRNRIKRRLRAAIYGLLSEDLFQPGNYMLLVKSIELADCDYNTIILQLRSAILALQ